MTVTEKIELAKLVAPFGAALLVFAGGFLTYTYQRRVDRREKLREKKQAAYEAYLHALYEAAMESNREPAITAARFAAGMSLPPERLFANEEKHDIHQKSKLSVFVMAPDSVVRAAGRYQRMIQVGTTASAAEKCTAFAELVSAMRVDSFEITNLTVDEVVRLSPINHN